MKNIYYFKDIENKEFLLYFAEEVIEDLLEIDSTGIAYTKDAEIFDYLSELARRYLLLDEHLTKLSEQLIRAKTSKNFSECEELEERRQVFLGAYGGSMHSALERLKKEMEMEGIPYPLAKQGA